MEIEFFMIGLIISGIGFLLLIIGLVGIVISAIRGTRKMLWGVVGFFGLILMVSGSCLYTVEEVPEITVGLQEGVAMGLLKVEAIGDGLDGVKLTLISNSENPLRVIISPGTIFEAQSPNVQSMVAIKEEVATLQHRGDSISLEILAACLDMRLEVPRKRDVFTVSNASATGDLMKLLSLPDFYNETLRVRQFAIWTITENPARDEYMGIGTFWGTGPDDEEMLEILKLFERAGIDSSKYRALQEITAHPHPTTLTTTLITEIEPPIEET